MKCCFSKCCIWNKRSCIQFVCHSFVMLFWYLIRNVFSYGGAENSNVVLIPSATFQVGITPLFYIQESIIEC